MVNLAESYLDLLARMLTRYGFEGELSMPRGRKKKVLDPVNKVAARAGIGVGVRTNFDPERRANGKDHPYDAQTMVGLKRLDNVQRLRRAGARRRRARRPDRDRRLARRRGDPDAGVLDAYGDRDRVGLAADSFAGPAAARRDTTRPTRAADCTAPEPLAVRADEVERNFELYGLLDEQVRFLEGWFKDTLPTVADRTWSVVRLDGDMYESTMDALVHLYPRLSVGGLLIVDDYTFDPCQQAVADYRAATRDRRADLDGDWLGVYWRRAMA